VNNKSAEDLTMGREAQRMYVQGSYSKRDNKNEEAAPERLINIKKKKMKLKQHESKVRKI